VLDKINASLIPLLFKLFIKFDIAYSPPSRRHMCPFTMVKVGNGEKAKFWTSPWTDGICPKDTTTKLFKKEIT
jgi:hypothetical protein